MKINFSKEHKDKLLYYINEYQNISNEERQIYEKIKSLQEELNELTANFQSIESKLQSFRDEEKEYMIELHKIYGDFTLNDLWESIYK
jgi:chromosome segregation ATPase